MLKLTSGQKWEEKPLSLSLSLSLLVAPVVLSIATFLALFLSYNNASAISDHSLSISTNIPTLESTINNTADEEVTIQKHEITINTNNPNGAKLFLSSKDNKTVPEYITNSGPATGSGSTSTSTIAESTGTISTPTKLSPNSFGFALDKNSSTVATNFSTNTTYESTDNTDKLTAKFTKLTPSTTPTEVYNKSGNHNNTKLSVYYGTNTNSLMREGKYEMDILYTIVSNTPTTDIPENNDDIIEINSKYAIEQTSGHERTITTNIKSNVPIQEEDIVLTINNKPCTDIRITQNFTENITKALSFTCKLPANDMGKYNINLKIPKLNINTIKTNAIEYIQAMQNFTYDQCTSMTEHQEKILGDKRDGEIYSMAKLKDGKCWMTQNLRYQLSTTRALTPQDSDVTQNWTPNRSTETTLSSAWDSDPEDYKTVRSYYDSSTYNTNGVYYTHTAATAGTTASMDNNGDEATGSICPKGWRLPKSNKNVSNTMNNEFYALVKQYEGSYSWIGDNEWGYYYNSSNMRSAPLNFVLSGYRGYISKVGSNGAWWSSTVSSSDNAYFMHMYPSLVYPRFNNHRYGGFSVRCLAREPQTIGSIEYMQDITPEHCANSTEHQTAILKDKRDNNTYTIAKLKDGKCWMTQNLGYQLSTTKALTPQDSDVQQNWTPNRSTETTLSSAWDSDPEGYKTVRSYYDSTKPEYGTYYTHVAATAGTTANMNNDGDEATGSVCPKGWRLPKARDTSSEPINNDFYQMAKHYVNSNMTWDTNSGYGYWDSGTHNLTSSPHNFIYSGYREYSSADVYTVGILGWWWSSTVSSSNIAFYMDMDSSSVKPRDYDNRCNGFSVRCLAR